MLELNCELSNNNKSKRGPFWRYFYFDSDNFIGYSVDCIYIKDYF